MTGTGVSAPVPLSETLTVASSGSLEVISRLALLVPVVEGEKVIVSVPLDPAAMVGLVLPQGFGPPFTSSVKSLASVPEISMLLTDKTAVPVFEIVTVFVDELPTSTSPNATGSGETEISRSTYSSAPMSGGETLASPSKSTSGTEGAVAEPASMQGEPA